MYVCVLSNSATNSLVNYTYCVFYLRSFKLQLLCFIMLIFIMLVLGLLKQFICAKLKFSMNGISWDQGSIQGSKVQAHGIKGDACMYP